MKNLLPIRKVAIALLAWAVYYAAQKAHLPRITADVSNQTAQGIVTFAAAYLMPDPRIQKTVTRLGLIAKARLLNQLLEAQANPPAPGPPAE